MTTPGFFLALWDWLMADPAHLMVAASAIIAATPTPPPNTALGRLYRAVEYVALAVGRAKDVGVPVPPALTSAAATLAKEAEGGTPDAPPSAPAAQPAP